MNLTPEKQEIYNFFLSHFNNILTTNDPLLERYEILSNRIIGGQYIYYVIRDKKEHEIYDVLFDKETGLLSLDTMAND